MTKYLEQELVLTWDGRVFVPDRPVNLRAGTKCVLHFLDDPADGPRSDGLPLRLRIEIVEEPAT